MTRQLTKEEKRIYQRLKDDFCHFATKCLKIRTKEGSIENLSLNKAQQYIHQQLENERGRTGKVRALILKGRQQGCSTYVGARFYHQVTMRFGCQAFILTHALDATNNLYKMAQRYYEHTPIAWKHDVGKSNSKELIFERLDSGYKLGTAGNKQVGRSATIQLLHGSEVAFWANAPEIVTGIMQAVPDASNTEIILESTANGIGNYFHTMWQAAEAGLNDYQAIFVPWYWQEEYQSPYDGLAFDEKELTLMDLYHLTAEQIMWRRKKIVELSVNGIDGEKAFQQEYPNTSSEAFILTGEDNYIPSDVVLLARKAEEVEPIGPLIIGCDPARYGDDRTAIIRRRGRLAYELQTFVKKDTMEISGIVHQIISNEKPAKVCIDVGGLGAGVVDRLNELGHKDIIAAINFGSKPLDIKIYRNKRAEMWGEMRAWLEDYPCKIPDSDELHSDLTGVKYKIDSNSRLLLESKEDMKKRGIRSSDAADALALTFSLPNSAISATINKQQNATFKALADDMAKRKQLMERSRFK